MQINIVFTGAKILCDSKLQVYMKQKNNDKESNIGEQKKQLVN